MSPVQQQPAEHGSSMHITQQVSIRPTADIPQGTPDECINSACHMQLQLPSLCQTHHPLATTAGDSRNIIPACAPLQRTRLHAASPLDSLQAVTPCTQAVAPAHLQMYSLGMLGSCLLKITLRPINLAAVQLFACSQVRAVATVGALLAAMQYCTMKQEACLPMPLAIMHNKL
jgi:hypothetical protein